MDMKQLLRPLRQRFSAFSQRERGLIAAVIVGGTLLVGYSALIDPALARARIAERQAAQAGDELTQLRTQLQVLQTQMQVDPDAPRRGEIAALQKELAEADAALKRVESGLVPPEEMNALLERLLARNTGLRLLSLKSLPPVNLGEATAADQKSESAGPRLFRHGVELKLEGGYGELHAWLRQLEEAPQKVLWGDVRYVVAEYPRAQLTLVVYTLSSDKSWLAI